MARPDDPDGKAPAAEVLSFPYSRVRPSGVEPFKDLGSSKYSEAFGPPDRQATGHWCSYCRGIWWGYALEVTCPVCGSRHG